MNKSLKFFTNFTLITLLDVYHQTTVTQLRVLGRLPAFFRVNYVLKVSMSVSNGSVKAEG